MDFIKLEIQHGVATLTIDRPPVNALNTALLLEFDQALDQVAAKPEAKVLVIAAAGQSAFIAGADIHELAALRDGLQAREFVERGQRIINKLDNFPRPTIAAITGACLGGGNELVMACDIRLAADSARFGQSEINLGIIPGFGGTQRLPRLVGRAKAMELILTGEMISAPEAARIGLVNKVVPQGTVLREAESLAQVIAQQGALAVRAAREAIDGGLERSLSEGLALEAEQFVSLRHTEDWTEGLQAFLQKRQPVFKGR